jgi:hypothetical protein
VIHLTTFPAPQPPADPFAAVLAYDPQRPDGLTKEVVARAAALGLLTAAGDAAALAQLHDDLDPAVVAAVAAGTGVVNPVVKRIVFLDALNVPAGRSESDATAALAGAVYDVVNHKPLTVTAAAKPAAAPAAAPPAVATPAAADLAGLDLLADEFEPLRVVLTRTLQAVRPDLYAAYRTLKDAGTAGARERAYGYAFGLLRRLIDQSHSGGGGV